MERLLDAARHYLDRSWGGGDCFLPMLYAPLGAWAYLARRYEGRVRARTFTGAEKPWVRIIVGGISGVVVGLFAKCGAGLSDDGAP
jgi:hypothetical protein